MLSARSSEIKFTHNYLVIKLNSYLKMSIVRTVFHVFSAPFQCIDKLVDYCVVLITPEFKLTDWEWPNDNIISLLSGNCRGK